MTITLSRKKLLRTCLIIVGILTVLHLGSVVLFFNYEHPLVDQYVSFFDFGIEENIPTYFSAILLLTGSIAMALAGRCSKGRNAFGWSTLAVIFLLLSIDEITQIHEAVGQFFEGFIKAEGVLYHVWVVPYTLLVIALGAVYLPFFLRLPADVKARFFIAGTLYIGGALGLEMIGSIEGSANGFETWTYTFLYSLEELCEMLGAVFFIDATMVLLTRHTTDLKISFKETR